MFKQREVEVWYGDDGAVFGPIKALLIDYNTVVIIDVDFLNFLDLDEFEYKCNHIDMDTILIGYRRCSKENVLKYGNYTKEEVEEFEHIWFVPNDDYRWCEIGEGPTKKERFW